MKDDIRKDSATAQFIVIRLMLAMTTVFDMKIGVVEIIGAYMKSGPMKREIYVRPPREWYGIPRGKIWKLLKLPYGVTEADRQWETVIEDWNLRDMGMDTVRGLSQLFLKIYPDGRLRMILEKVTDDVLFSGNKLDMDDLFKRIYTRLDIR